MVGPQFYMKTNRKIDAGHATANVDVLIERLKKVRALNCNPSDVGMDTYTLRRLPFNKLSILTKSL